MSGGGGQKASETKTEPWGPQQQYIQQLFREAEQLYGQGGPGVYPGTFTAGFNPAEKQAQRSAMQAAKGPQTQIAQGAAGANQFLTDPGILSPSSNPYLAASAEAATRPLYQQLGEQVLPNIRGESVAAGTYGSNRQGIAEGLAAGRTAQAAGDVTSNMYSQAYGQGLDALARGTALAPGTQALQTVPAGTMAGVGAQQRSYEQSLIDEQIQKFNYQQGLPYQNLAQFQNFIQGGYGGSTIAQPGRAGGSQLGQVIGGGLSGAAAGGMVGGPWGAGAGALLGILPGLFG